MRSKLGNLLMLLGAALVIAALLLFVHNRKEAQTAQSAAEELLPQVIAEIEARNEQLTVQGAAVLAPVVENGEEDVLQLETTPSPTLFVNPYDSEMTVVEIDGNGYIGTISISKLQLELPVMAEWSYPKLRKSPCRYSGSTKTDDIVILAHNYSRHFGKIKQLNVGDEVVFTDMNGVVTRYSVAEVDTLSPYDVEEMTAGDFDLTLFTCTYGGKSRITVRCDRAE